MANSQNMSTSNGYIIYWIESYINSQSGNSSNIQVKVWCKRTNEGYTTYGNGTVYLNVDGQTRQSGITNSQTLTSTARLLHDESYTINHNSDGTKSIYIQAYISHDRFSSSWQGWTYTLTSINVLKPPSAPTSCSHTGKFDNGCQTTVSWSGATGTINYYDIQVRFWTKDGGFQAWWTHQTVSGTATSFVIGHNGVTNDGLQARVCARNSAGSSSWKEGGTVYKQSVKVNDNGFKTGTIRVWDSSQWKQCFIRVWNGTQWTIPK